jgi:hypothetical protein
LRIALKNSGYLKKQDIGRAIRIGEKRSMSTTSIEGRFVYPAIPRDCDKGCEVSDCRAERTEPGLLAILSLSSWRMLILETLVLLALMAALRHWFFDVIQIPGMPHPYWLPVLLASSHYGVTGGMIATAAASVVYLFELSPQSAAQDFYAYARMAAVQPTAWLATALVLGGLRSLYIYQTGELAENLAACRRCASHLADGLERATAEIAALERRIAADACSVAALSRSFSNIDLSDRWAAATSFGDLFRVGAGATTFTIYMKDSDGYVPVLAVEDDAIRPTKSIESLHPTTIDAMVNENARCEAMAKPGASYPGIGRHVFLIPPPDVSTEPLAAIVCQTLRPAQDEQQFRRRIDELSRAFATILSACADQPSRVRR